MAALTVWKFATPHGAEEALLKLEDLQAGELIRVEDASIVSWEVGRKKPATSEMHSTAASGALGGSFWGLLFGLIFFVPFLGLAIGAASGALFGSLKDAGISEDFIKSVRAKITPGTSALFALTSDAVQDKVADAFRGTHAELIQTNLSNEQEARLHEAFAQD